MSGSFISIVKLSDCIHVISIELDIDEAVLIGLLINDIAFLVNFIPILDSDFIDVMICGNIYLASLGGDYDGDMLYLRAVFTKEANAEAERLIYSKTNIFGTDGKLTRNLKSISKDCIMGLYELTKEM